MWKLIEDASKASGISEMMVIHPDSDQFKEKVLSIVRTENEYYGLKHDDHHQIRNDIEYIRAQRLGKKQDLATTRKEVIKMAVNAIGLIVVAGFSYYLGSEK